MFKHQKKNSINASIDKSNIKPKKENNKILVTLSDMIVFYNLKEDIKNIIKEHFIYRKDNLLNFNSNNNKIKNKYILILDDYIKKCLNNNYVQNKNNNLICSSCLLCKFNKEELKDISYKLDIYFEKRNEIYIKLIPFLYYIYKLKIIPYMKMYIPFYFQSQKPIISVNKFSDININLQYNNGNKDKKNKYFNETLSQMIKTEQIINEIQREEEKGYDVSNINNSDETDEILMEEDDDDINNYLSMAIENQMKEVKLKEEYYNDNNIDDIIKKYMEFIEESRKNDNKSDDEKDNYDYNVYDSDLYNFYLLLNNNDEFSDFSGGKGETSKEDKETSISDNDNDFGDESDDDYDDIEIEKQYYDQWYKLNHYNYNNEYHDEYNEYSIDSYVKLENKNRDDLDLNNDNDNKNLNYDESNINSNRNIYENNGDEMLFPYVDYRDIESELKISLYQAIENFNPNKNANFLFYVELWLKQKAFKFVQKEIDFINKSKKTKDYNGYVLNEDEGHLYSEIISDKTKKEVEDLILAKHHLENYILIRKNLYDINQNLNIYNSQKDLKDKKKELKKILNNNNVNINENEINKDVINLLHDTLIKNKHKFKGRKNKKNKIELAEEIIKNKIFSGFSS